MFGMLGIFSEFEREMIVACVNAGLARARDTIARDGHFISKAGKRRKRLGRPNADPKKVEAALRELAKGAGVLKTVGLGTGTVQRLRQSMAVAVKPPRKTPAASKNGARRRRSRTTGHFAHFNGT
jgi:DNA invertase Pin-like site-specific DNA recombinase